MEHLWVKNPQPPEYAELVLCRDIFHCLPSELDNEDADRIAECYNKGYPRAACKMCKWGPTICSGHNQTMDYFMVRARQKIKLKERERMRRREWK